MALFDDGNGPALYVGGYPMTSAGGVPVRNLARWDGQNWSDVGGGLLAKGASVPGPTKVTCMAVYDDGGGPGLYIGGDFDTAGTTPVHCLARWRDGQWSAVGSFQLASYAPVVRSLAVFDDGAGPALYVGGSFWKMDGQTGTSNIARWKDGAPTPLGTGTDMPVNALTVYDDGDGPKLYAAGEFFRAGSVIRTSRIARWTGSTWERLAAPDVGPDATVRAMAVFDDGTGSALYLTGAFTSIDVSPSINARMIARWRNGVWTGLTQFPAFSFSVSPPDTGGGHALAAAETENGRRLVVSGSFRLSGSASLDTNVAMYDGQSWSEPPGGIVKGPVFGLLEHDDGRGRALFAAGSFSSTGGGAANRIARWQPGGWLPVQGGPTNAPNGDYKTNRITDFATYDPGDGRHVYIGGVITHIGSQAISSPVAWDGNSFHPVESLEPQISSVLTFEVFDSGTGPELYAGGTFWFSGTTQPQYVARWDGLTWSALGQGLTPPSFDGPRVFMTVHDDGSGPALYVAGSFAAAGGQPAANIAKWDGAQWYSLGAGITGQYQGPVHAMASLLVDGRPLLYAGGLFTAAGGSTIENIAAWDGSGWVPVAATSPVKPSFVKALVAWSGSLYAGGSFKVSDGVFRAGVARLDGDQWTLMGDIDPLIGRYVSALALFDDGGGPALYAGGDIAPAQDSVPNAQMARWTGAAWDLVDGGIDGTVMTLVGLDDGSGPSLFAGGTFAFAGNRSSGCIAKLQGCKERCPADYNGDSIVDAADAREFVSVFEAGRPSADINADGFIDGIDYDLFMNVYEGGCD